MKGSIFYVGLALALLIAGCSKSATTGLNLKPGDLEKTKAPKQKDKAPKFIDGSYVVVFKKNVKNVDFEIDDLGKKFKFKSKHRFKNTIKGFHGTLTPELVELIKKDPRVDYIEQDQLVSIDNNQLNPPSWGLDRIDQRSLPLDAAFAYTNMASTVDVYIFDTGIRLSHEEFGGRAIMGYDGYGWQGTSSDANGHGTHVAGTIGGNSYGIAKGVRLIAVRVLGADGVGAWSEVAAGIEWATTHHTTNPAVGNLSLGAGGSVRFVEDAVRQAVADGITMCLSAGNQRIDAEYYTPARTREGITVGATDIGDAVADFSNFGNVIDLFAPGVNILSANNYSDNSTASLSGTSMAAPHVAGVAALYLAAHPSASPAEVENVLKANATPNMLSGVPPETNNLLLNADFNHPPALIKPFTVGLKDPTDYNGNVSVLPVCTWYPSTGAKNYRVQISTTPEFSNIVFERMDGAGTSVSGFMLQDNATYYWRVNASNPAGTSDWSRTWTFTTGSRMGEVPTGTTPANGATNVAIPATIAWYSSSGARSFTLQVATDATFNNIVYNNMDVVESSAIIKTLQPQTTYYWRVNGNYVFMLSPWSATSSFRTR